MNPLLTAGLACAIAGIALALGGHDPQAAVAGVVGIVLNAASVLRRVRRVEAFSEETAEENGT